MRAVRRRRGQTTLQLFRAGIQAFLEARRKSSANDQLLLQAGRQAVLFGEARRKMALVLGIPAVDGLFVVVIVIIAIVPVVAFVVLIVTLTVTISVAIALGENGAACEEEKAKQNCNEPFRCFH